MAWMRLNPCGRRSEIYSANVITPSSRFLTDIGNGYLANVTWITPSTAESDHSLRNNGSGPSWVASIVNAIGDSKYWGTTAIFVVWDDWGGWFDHVPPTRYNSYELSFRVPLLVISPYAKRGYISTVHHEFGSILKLRRRRSTSGHWGRRTFEPTISRIVLASTNARPQFYAKFAPDMASNTFLAKRRSGFLITKRNQPLLEIVHAERNAHVKNRR